MKENDRKDTPKNPTEKRAETRETLEKMQRIELKLPSLPIYVFNVKDTSQNGLCFLVKAWREVSGFTSMIPIKETVEEGLKDLVL